MALGTQGLGAEIVRPFGLNIIARKTSNQTVKDIINEIIEVLDDIINVQAGADAEDNSPCGEKPAPPADGSPPAEEKSCCKIDPQTLYSPSPDSIKFNNTLTLGPATAQIAFEFIAEGELTTDIDNATVTHRNRCRPPRCGNDELDVAVPWQFKGKISIKAVIGSGSPVVNTIFGNAASATLSLDTTWTGMTSVTIKC
jgi:hypothetical protein